MSLLLKKKLKMQNEKSKLRNSTIFNFITYGDSPRRKFLIFNSSIDGFTLIEVLLSLTILTIILGAVYSSFFTVQRALERFDGVSLKYHEVRMTLDIIRREIEGAFFTRYNEQSIENRTHFIIEDRDILGKPTSKMSLTTFSFKVKGDLNTVSYSVEERDGTLDLVKTETIAVSPIKGYSVQMIEGIKGFTVETLFNDKWVKTWDTLQTGSIPDTVRVSIAFDDKGEKITLTEYARPRIGKQL